MTVMLLAVLEEGKAAHPVHSEQEGHAQDLRARRDGRAGHSHSGVPFAEDWTENGPQRLHWPKAHWRIGHSE